VGYIKKCVTTEQTEEILNYLEKKGEIPPKYAENLRKLLMDKGLAFFHSKNEENCCLK